MGLDQARHGKTTGKIEPARSRTKNRFEVRDRACSDDTSISDSDGVDEPLAFAAPDWPARDDELRERPCAHVFAVTRTAHRSPQAKAALRPRFRRTTTTASDVTVGGDENRRQAGSAAPRVAIGRRRPPNVHDASRAARIGLAALLVGPGLDRLACTPSRPAMADRGPLRRKRRPSGPRICSAIAAQPSWHAPPRCSVPCR